MPAAALDWTPASRDYALHRPGYPDEVFALLSLLGVGRPGQAILDLGVGTGHLAIPLAQRGAVVTGVDPSPGQLAEARARALAAGVQLALVEAIAEEAPLEAGGFDAATASMCWGYLDARRVVPRVWRALRPGGLLLVASLVWTSDEHPVARLTAELLRRHNPAFERRPTPPTAPVVPVWAEGRFRLRTWHRETVHLSFTREGWCGRQRASKWVGAELSPTRVAAFDAELARALEAHAPPAFAIPHAVALDLYQRIP